MATSPTALAGASTSSSIVSAPASEAAKYPVVPLLIAMAIGFTIAALGIGSGVYYLARAGRWPMQGETQQRSENAVQVRTHAMVLEPLLVNLADANGSSYLRVALSLRVQNAPDRKGVDAKSERSKEDKGTDETVAAVRDTVLTVLGRQTADRLLALDGKEHLKTDLKVALAAHNPDLKVMDVFFTDFLVQR